MPAIDKPAARLAIAQSELFADWPSEALARVVGAAEILRLEDGAPLHQPGDAAEYLYLVASGGLRLSCQGPAGRKFTAWMQVAGDFHGIGPVMSGTAHIYLATARGPTQLVRIPGPLIRRLLRADGRLALAMFGGFYRRYRATLNMYETASTAALRARIAGVLHSLLARSPRARATVALHLSQSEIAGMLGTRRQAVNRELKALAAAGAVRLAYGKISVVDPALLGELARTGR